MDVEDVEELNVGIQKRKVVNNYREIDRIIGTSYSTFLLSVDYEDLDSGTLTVRQLKDSTKLISEKSVKIPMNKFRQLIKESEDI